MFSPSSAGVSTQAETRAHGTIDRVSDSFGGIFCQQGHVQPSRDINDKAASYSYTHKNPFHADSPSLNSYGLPSQHSCNDNNNILSTFHSRSSTEPDHMPTFDERARFTIAEDLNVAADTVFQNRQEKQGDDGTLQFNPAAWPRQTYKSMGDHIFNKPSVLTRADDPTLDRQRLPPSTTNTIQYLGHRSLDNYVPQQRVAHTLGGRASTTSPANQPLIKGENMTSFGVMKSDIERDSMDAARIPLHRYDSNTFNQQSPIVSMPGLCGDAAVCHPYSEITPAHSHPSPHQLLGSQPSEAASIHSWHPEYLEQLSLDYPQNHIQSSDGQVCFPSSQPPCSRPFQSFPGANYQTINGINQQANGYVAHPPEAFNGLMSHMGVSSPQLTSSISEPPLSVPPMSCSAPTMESTYTPIPYAQPPRPQTAQLEMHHHPSIPYQSPLPMPQSPQSTRPTMPRRSTNGYSSQQSFKTRQQPSPPKRRAKHCRKPASFSGQSTSRINKGISPSSSSNAINGCSRHTTSHGKTSNGNNSKPITMKFEVLTPENREKLLNGVSKSGSADTKAKREQEAARREQEAAARRRRDAELHKEQMDIFKRKILELGGDLKDLDKLVKTEQYI